MDIHIERAHRSLLAKPKENTAPPRAIIVRFLDYRVKEQVIQQAWKQKTTYEGRTIYFNQDYTNEVQKKRKQEEERDELQRLRTQSSWTMVTRQKEKRSQPHTTGPDPQAVTE
ncbi:hypothetical protein KUCAC02_030044 [Chaenocephalus aceratus]|uniref:Uncharacterized protein n=1 Tax=Chaenocephalus aceratus TaxID=36190 RepID=A0ACB9XJC6_CHAAC|nr:hypothetical protein KUCAC02_030044 [Chaenocephalus aceratus]